MSVYRVESGGRAPAGLSTGDEVVTGGGTYRITGVNADGSYQSQLVNKNQTTRNYGGSYQTRNSPYTMSGVSDYTRSKLNGLESGYTPSGSLVAASLAQAIMSSQVQPSLGSSMPYFARSLLM